MAMMLIDQTKDTACKTAEADAIRAKTGGSADINYDYENNKGFADAIAAIPSGSSVQYKSGTYTPAENTQNISVAVGFEPEYALIITDPQGLEQTTSWKQTLSLYDRVSEVAYSIQTRYNNGYYANPAMKLNAGTYSDGVFIFNRVGNYSFLAGVTYYWFCIREALS